MAHGNKIRGFLGAHDPSYLGDGQDIALGDLTALNFFKGFWLEKDLGLGRCNPRGQAFGTNIDHPGSSCFVQVGEVSHFPQ